MISSHTLHPQNPRRPQPRTFSALSSDIYHAHPPANLTLLSLPYSTPRARNTIPQTHPILSRTSYSTAAPLLIHILQQASAQYDHTAALHIMHPFRRSSCFVKIAICLFFCSVTCRSRRICLILNIYNIHNTSTIHLQYIPIITHP